MRVNDSSCAVKLFALTFQMMRTSGTAKQHVNTLEAGLVEREAGLV